MFLIHINQHHLNFADYTLHTIHTYADSVQILGTTESNPRLAPHLHTMRDNKSRSCYTYMNFDHTAIQPSPNEKSTISLILLFKKICRIVCHPLPAPLPPTTVGDVTPLPAPQLCLFNVLSLSEFVPCEYVLDLVWLGLRLTKKSTASRPKK